MDEKENTKELVVVDVTHYKKVKKALHESEERYRQLFENVPIGIYRTTADGRIVDANPALVKMLGYKSFAELSTRNLEKEYLNQGYPRLDFINRLERDGEITGLEEVWSKKDGSKIHVRENAKLTKTADGKVLFEGTVEDITLSKQSEAAQKTRAMQLEVLNHLICSGNQADSLQEFFNSILDKVTSLLGFEMAAIYLFEPGFKNATLQAQKGFSKKFLRQARSKSTKNYPFFQVLASSQSFFGDHFQDSKLPLVEKGHWRAAACILLVCKGRIIGTLNVATGNRLTFSPEEKSILELIGKEAGTLISKLQTETALRESEKYYRTLIDTSPDIIAVTDLDGNLQMVNQRFVSLSGYYLDEIIGKNSFHFVAETDLDQFIKSTKKFIKTKKLSTIEYGFKKKNGEVVPLELSASLLLDARGKPRGLIGFGRDISLRKQVENALRQSENKYRELVENHNDVIFAVDATGKVEYISPPITRITGYTPAEVIGRNLFDFFGPEDRKRYGQQMLQTIDSGSSVGEFSITVKDKSSKWVSASSRCVVENGKVVGIRGIMSDITKRKRAEEQLRFLSSITENTSEAIIVTDANFVITYINKVGEQFFGYTLNELKGKTPVIFNAEPRAEQIQQELYKIIASGKTHLGESLNRRKDGSTFYCEYKVMPLMDSNGKIYAYSSVQRDISERKEAEAKLLAYQEQLRALTSEMLLVEERERRRIASELHDQIGQNLALCKLKIAALENDLGAAAMKDELAVVRRLLECSIQDARSLIFDLSPPILYELGFQAALEWLAERMQEQFHIPVEFESRLRDPELKNDQQVILFQVVRELMMNVGKHSRASQAQIILSHEGPSLKIQVKDDGVGFDASQIFAPREQNSSFGFFSMRERLNFLGGGMEIKSKPGQGSQIILTVPQKGSGAVPKKENS